MENANFIIYSVLRSDVNKCV